MSLHIGELNTLIRKIIIYFTVYRMFILVLDTKEIFIDLN